jgi:hypothetical protein
MFMTVDPEEIQQKLLAGDFEPRTAHKFSSEYDLSGRNRYGTTGWNAGGMSQRRRARDEKRGSGVSIWGRGAGA